MTRLLLAAALLAAAALPAAADDPASAEAPLDSLIWISETAAVDSLNSYWRHLEDDWYSPLTADDLTDVLTRGRLDSLRALGDRTIVRMVDGRPWRLDLRLFDGVHFTRVEGFTPSTGFRLDRPGMRQPSWTVRASYATAWKRAEVVSDVQVPLLTRRPRDARGRLTANPWTLLALEAEGGRTVRWFGGDRRPERELQAMFSGEDPSHYYEQRWWAARLRARPVPPLSLTAGVGGADDRPMGVATRWNLFGEEGDVIDNLAVPAVVRRSVATSAEWRTRNATLGAELDWRRVSDGVAGTGDGAARWYRTLRANLDLSARDPLHTEWVLRGEWTSVDRQAPVQWKTWLGDWGTLRGYEAGELVGDKGGWLSLDARWNVDLFKAVRFPLLKNWGLQPITFVEAGRTWNTDGPEAAWSQPGWRADAGFGFGRVMGVGERGPESLRMYVAKPIGNRVSGEPWRVVVATEWW